ncbi:ABC transporter permease [Fodinicurvata fenggangensis]|uniref:ABC transporter permease n=1 Tax=Fodinicurvata fenggangensis TaxID=1121830 RepID=UPI0009DE9931
MTIQETQVQDEVVPPAKDTPFRRTLREFAASRVAVVGAVVLLLIIFAAVFAPWIAPQNPYDLNEIRVEHSRLEPGAAGRADPESQSLPVPISGEGESGRETLELSGSVPFESAEASWEWVAPERVAVSLDLQPEQNLKTLEQELRVEGLPRGAELSVGEKHDFRNFWLVAPDEITAFEVQLPEGHEGGFELEIRAQQAEGEIEQVYWLGTDGQGRDMFSAILYGLRISISVGVFSGALALTIGLVVGLTAAYAGGRIDALIMRIVDLQLSFPAILVALLLLAILGRGPDKVILALVIAQWAYYARTARSAGLVERSKEYIEAARCLALSRWRIVLRHMLPNCIPPMIVVGTVQVANAIALEATLSFLGLGMPQTEPSLGLLISNGFDYLLSGRYWISVFPGIALLVTIVAINLVGDRLREVLNPRMRRDE